MRTRHQRPRRWATWATMGATAHLIDRVAGTELWTVCNAGRKSGYPVDRVVGIDQPDVGHCDRCRIRADQLRARAAAIQTRTRRRDRAAALDPVPERLTSRQIRALEVDARRRGVLGM